VSGLHGIGAGLDWRALALRRVGGTLERLGELVALDALADIFAPLLLVGMPRARFGILRPLRAVFGVTSRFVRQTTILRTK